MSEWSLSKVSFFEIRFGQKSLSEIGLCEAFRFGYPINLSACSIRILGPIATLGN
jgi:hypothetical protein